MVTKRVASTTYESTFFAYAKNGRTVTHVVGEQWNDDGLTACFPLQTHGYVNTFRWEYRYDGARARYAARALDPARLYMYLDPKNGWSDYDSDDIYADFTVNITGPPTTDRRFEPGIGRTDSAGSAYYHADHLGTIRGVTNASVAWTEPMAFTAFGERIVGTQNSMSTRFGYVGSFGYQASGEYPFLHVGARYYDPATGRFLQRDPIGIEGGLNVYDYVQGNPVVVVDPSGEAAQAPIPPEGVPIPPGYGPGWEWVPNRNPDPKPPQDPGHYKDPNGHKWRYHPEDEGHNPHWDDQPPKGPKERIPVDPKKPVFKPKPSWWEWFSI
jgi:RHS repeat-associated protein